MTETEMLSEHFSVREFERSSIAAKYGIDNTMTKAYIKNAQALCEHILEPLRRYVGGPIIINSGYRSEELNNHQLLKRNGSSSTSQHCTGEAADIRIKDRNQGLEWAGWISEHCLYDQIILEKNAIGSIWLHVSYSRVKNRQKIYLDYTAKPRK